MNPVKEKFIVDTMLGKLGRWMLLLGYDAVYFRGTKDEELIEWAKRENRILITRDTHLALEKYPEHSVLLKTIHFWEQLKKIVEEYPLAFSETFLSRCSLCNVLLEGLERAEALPELPEKVRAMAKMFFRCPVCRRMYWDGTHPIQILELLETNIGLRIERNFD